MGKNILLKLLFVGGSLMSCNDNGILEKEPINLNPPFCNNGETQDTLRNNNWNIGINFSHPFYGNSLPIVGDTSISYHELNLPVPDKKVDLRELKNPKLLEAPFRMVVLGGSMTAGFRDYGWFNEGMITSYPNLIANQMGIDFKLPLYDKEEANGLNRKVLTNFNPTGGPVPKFKNVVNNTDQNIIKTFGDGINRRLLKMDTDSYVTPFNTNKTNPFYRLDYNIAEEFKRGKFFDFFIYEPQNDRLFDGLIKSITEKTLEQLKERDWKKYPEEGFDISKWSPVSAQPIPNESDILVRRMHNRGLTKGVILNTPYLHHFPMKGNYLNDLIKVLEKYQVPGIYTGEYSSNSNNPTYSYNYIKNTANLFSGGTSTVDSIISPKVNINIKPGLSSSKKASNEMISFTDKNWREGLKEKTNEANKSLRIYSEYLNVPICDINSLYEKVYKGDYITHDGIKVNGEYLTGNFFSIDGFSPTAFGQAVITNEIITTINSFYKTNIPLIPTKHYLK